MLKKMAAFILTLTIAISTFASCSNKDSSSSKGDSSSSKNNSSASSNADNTEKIAEPSLTIDGKKVDTADLIMCTVDGKDIDFDTYRYYYQSVLSIYANNYGVSREAIAEDKTRFKNVLDDVTTYLKQEAITSHLANENNIKLDKDDEKSVDEMINSAKEKYESDEAFKTDLKKAYLTEDVYRKLIESSVLSQKIQNQLLSNEGKYATKKADFKKIVQDPDKYSRVIHVLIPFQCQAEITDKDTKSKYDDLTLAEKLTAKKTAYDALSNDEQTKAKNSAKKLADEVLVKVNNGDDFKSLVTKYGWDPGMESSPEGYYINKDTTFVEEFKTESFKLKENETSGLVESKDFGWFIIKRLPIDMKYVEKNIDSMISEYDEPAIQKMFTEIMEKMDVKQGKYYEKLTIDSIT